VHQFWQHVGYRWDSSEIVQGFHQCGFECAGDLMDPFILCNL